jgi:hypothetical protein
VDRRPSTVDRRPSTVDRRPSTVYRLPSTVYRVDAIGRPRHGVLGDPDELTARAVVAPLDHAPAEGDAGADDASQGIGKRVTGANLDIDVLVESFAASR